MDQPVLVKRVLIDIAGFGLIVVGLLVGWLPGPGGIFFYIPGLKLLAINHLWAEKLLNQLKKHSGNLVSSLFPDNALLKIVYDFLSIAVLVLIALLLDHITHSIIKAIVIWLGFLAVLILLLNRRRAQRIVVFINRMLGTKKTKA